MIPPTEIHHGVTVVRDDLYPGGTKARIFERLFMTHNEIVYPCAAFSRTQVSLAMVAKKLGRKATLVIPARKKPTPETLKAGELGAGIIEVPYGYYSVVLSRAKAYALRSGGYLAPLGFDTPQVILWLCQEALRVDFTPDEVWCAAGSGVLSRALQLAWPDADHNAVQVGKACNVGRATRHLVPWKLDQPYPFPEHLPFPSDLYYDAKAYSRCEAVPGKKVLFWNVLGD